MSPAALAALAPSSSPHLCCTVLQGPPGTGKTRTLARYVAAALAALPPGRQLLAVAASNVAVDNLVQGLLELRVAAVRLGQPVKVSTSRCAAEATWIGRWMDG